MSESLSVVEALEQELEALPRNLRESGVAAIARAMARRIDEGRGSPSECGKVCLQALETLRAMAPPKKENDSIDELTERRARRLAARRAASADLSRS